MRRREIGGPGVAVTAAAFHAVTHLVARRRFSGHEHVPASGPALLVSNHLSHLDPVFLGVFVDLAGRLPRFLAKESLWHDPVVGSIMVRTRQIPVRHAVQDAGSSLSEAQRAFDDGGVVLVFPEGRVNRSGDERPRPGRPGAASLALMNSEVPVIPLAVWGTRAVYDHDRRRFRPLPRRTIAVAAGPPIPLDDLRGRPRGGSRRDEAALLRETVDRMMGGVRELFDEATAQHGR